MTFLEYVAERLMGPPVSRSNGRSTWHCPFHEDNHPSFCTLPPKDGCKDRYRCFSCGAWGDEFDLLKRFHDNENFGDRKRRLDQMREDYEREVIPEATSQPANSSLRGQGEHGNDPLAVGDAWADSMDDLCDWEVDQSFGLGLLTQFKERCDQHGVSLDDLLQYWRDFEDWKADSDQRHLAECDDPDCEAAVCRASRGLPPLTEAEIEAGRREREEAKRQQKERIRRTIHKTLQRGGRRKRKAK